MKIAKKDYGRSLKATMLPTAVFVLAACGGASEAERQAQAKAEQALRDLALAESRAARAEAELARRDAEAARLVRQQQADRELTQFARATVRSAQLTDMAGCRIVPASLSQTTHYDEFGTRLAAAYPAACQRAVADYRAERQQVADRERAAGERQAQARQAQQRQVAAARTPQQPANKR
jgi:hypothetical protein